MQDDMDTNIYIYVHKNIADSFKSDDNKELENKELEKLEE